MVLRAPMSDALVNIIIVAQAKGNIGAEVFEVAAVGDLSVRDRDWSSLFKVIVEELFLCSACFIVSSCCCSVSVSASLMSWFRVSSDSSIS
jgi:hypothetical protein